MSCDAAASIAMFWLAATSPVHPRIELALAPPASVAQEPLFADIVKRAKGLKAQAVGMTGRDAPVPAAFASAIGELSALDMKGHLTLAQRGTDGDLKCILRGISQDLPLKLAAVQSATDRKARDLALRDLAYLLNDNVEVITAPPAPPA